MSLQRVVKMCVYAPYSSIKWASWPTDPVITSPDMSGPHPQKFKSVTLHGKKDVSDVVQKLRIFRWEIVSLDYSGRPGVIQGSDRRGESEGDGTTRGC